jgi:hypothetical protein
MTRDVLHSKVEATKGPALSPIISPSLASRLVIGRRFWLSVHKWIGLFAGALFVLIGLALVRE